MVVGYLLLCVLWSVQVLTDRMNQNSISLYRLVRYGLWYNLSQASMYYLFQSMDSLSWNATFLNIKDRFSQALFCLSLMAQLAFLIANVGTNSP